MDNQQQQQTEIVGIIKEGIYRKKSLYAKKYDECSFELQTGERVYCDFIPNIRAYWKVRVMGTWTKSRETFLADDIIFIEKTKTPKKLPKGQLKLEGFEK